ncbi:MAG: DinB family protein [Chloroflexi bacterium]|nr:DinB family protein [Chloroflexota bacterium]
MNVDTARKVLNKQQTALRDVMTSYDQHEEAINLFLSHHAMLHSAQVADFAHWSYEDAILDGLDEAQIRRIPKNCEHSIAWLLWHMARIEDVTMNILVAGTPQLLLQDDWLTQMNITMRDTGNEIADAEVLQFSQTVEIEALRAYRVAVGKQTQAMVQTLQPSDLKRKVDSDRLQTLRIEEAVIEEAAGLLNYWGKRNVAGLLLMPATRHNIVHLNEAYRLKNKR